MNPLDEDRMKAMQEFLASKSKLSEERLHELMKQLEVIAGEQEFLPVFSFLVWFSQFNFSIEEMQESHPEQNYSESELAVLGGMLLKAGVSEEIKIADYERFEELCNMLWGIFHEIHGQLFSKSPMMEPIFYSDSGAFDFQYIDLLESRYGKDREWILSHRGFSIETAKAVLLALEKKRREMVFKGTNREERISGILEEFCFSLDDLAIEGVAQAEIVNFIAAFTSIPGETNANFKSIGDGNDIYPRPIIKLGDDRFFLPLFGLLPRAVYSEPIWWMFHEDKSYYKTFATKNRGDGSEEMAYAALKDTIGAGKLFRNIDVMSNPRTRLTEADLLGFIGSKAIIVQVKSKSLTIKSRQGDLESIKNDYNAAIQEAYDQGELVRGALLDGTFSFKNSDGSEFVPPCKVDGAYVLCVTSEAFPGSHILRILLKKDAAEKEAVPMVTSIFDLHLITHYLSDPYEFLFYMRQRDIYSQSLLAQSEISVLAFHLKQSLYIEEEASMLVLDESFSNALVPHFLKENGKVPEDIDMPDPRNPWKNDRFNALVKSMTESKEEHLTDAILFLYSLSGSARDKLFSIVDARMEHLKKNPDAHSASGYFVFGKERVMIGVFCARTEETLKSDMAKAFHIRKYSAKSSNILGLGFLLEYPENACALIYDRTPWKFNAPMEELLKTYVSKLKTTNLHRGKGRIGKVGRNEPCPCGSEEKYKRCCGL